MRFVKFSKLYYNLVVFNIYYDVFEPRWLIVVLVRFYTHSLGLFVSRAHSEETVHIYIMYTHGSTNTAKSITAAFHIYVTSPLWPNRFSYKTNTTMQRTLYLYRYWKLKDTPIGSIAFNITTCKPLTSTSKCLLCIDIMIIIK